MTYTLASSDRRLEEQPHYEECACVLCVLCICINVSVYLVSVAMGVHAWSGNGYTELLY